MTRAEVEGASLEIKRAQEEAGAADEASNDTASKTQENTPQAEASNAGSEADETAGQACS